LGQTLRPASIRTRRPQLEQLTLFGIALILLPSVPPFLREKQSSSIAGESV